MSLSAIDKGVQTLRAAQSAGKAAWQQRMQDAIDPVAKLFGESSQRLTQDLKANRTSLAAYAQAKGVSEQDLAAAIKQGIQQASTQRGATLSDAQISNLVSTIGNRVHAGGPDAAVPGSATKATDADGDRDGGADDGAGASSAPPRPAGTPAQQIGFNRAIFNLRVANQAA